MQIRILEQTKLVESDGWVARLRPPDGAWNGRVILLLHGWTGDENLMWIFARKLPSDSWMIAPRGPLVSQEGGYAWATPKDGVRPDISQFINHSRKLVGQLPVWVPEYSVQSRLDIVGFSQGAAMAYTLCLEATPVKIAPLAGYLPPGFEDNLKNRSFSGIKAFVAHNTDDKLVAIAESKKAAEVFASRGAKVNFCEGTGGHKLHSSCFNGLDKFLLD